ncbi:MAG: aminoacyl-tRNA hydrolase [Candidatus Omnitrophica bacterium]|nr:aminoacyl-tRNA hydrolase [Candidatus Omnitrophota bacterium]
MKVIVGLGNPGQTYQGTRHNVGFAVIQALADRRGVALTHRTVSPADGRPAGVFGEYEHGGQTIRLLMPLTMMNESGEALRAAGASPEDLLIVCDDVNLPLGTLRLRAEGGAGGHHGLVSCLEALGTEQVPRLRLGVGAPDQPANLTDFVLSPFGSGERPLVRRMVEQARDACEAWVTEGIEAAMSRYNKAQET